MSENVTELPVAATKPLWKRVPAKKIAVAAVAVVAVAVVAKLASERLVEVAEDAAETVAA